MENVNVPEMFGSLVFDERVMRQRLSDEVFASLKKTIDENVKLDENVADAVAEEMKIWRRSNKR